ncbi:hypothetical protein IQ06DRAFT_345759 [Phaeosphaeriaceae sp. SRC1lsM3a]|nr:hypothetical protein IQ06DRAFT_345759 [Stagonospora sp. SRC1lsM3a]
MDAETFRKTYFAYMEPICKTDVLEVIQHKLHKESELHVVQDKLFNVNGKRHTMDFALCVGAHGRGTVWIASDGTMICEVRNKQPKSEPTCYQPSSKSEVKLNESIKWPFHVRMNFRRPLHPLILALVQLDILRWASMEAPRPGMEKIVFPNPEDLLAALREFSDSSEPQSTQAPKPHTTSQHQASSELHSPKHVISTEEPIRSQVSEPKVSVNTKSQCELDAQAAYRAQCGGLYDPTLHDYELFYGQPPPEEHAATMLQLRLNGVPGAISPPRMLSKEGSNARLTHFDAPSSLRAPEAQAAHPHQNIAGAANNNKHPLQVEVPQSPEMPEPAPAAPIQALCEVTNSVEHTVETEIEHQSAVQGEASSGAINMFDGNPLVESCIHCESCR